MTAPRNVLAHRGGAVSEPNSYSFDLVETANCAVRAALADKPTWSGLVRGLLDPTGTRERTS